MKPRPWKLDRLDERWLPAVLYPELVRDVNPTPQPIISPADEFVSVGGVTFFRGSQGDAVDRLCRSDGTNAGTFVVRDTADGGPLAPAKFAAVGNVVYFAANSE